ncbi:MAG: translocase [Crenarchaeota archaeon]|nr:MAG: translocase [Thermoproteota archaeon]RDJ32985.1 MAG: translocase [Thermoproteota archaeon]RDJ35813.1 MAG: translocase [Thermoproteota archaeon]RDJ36511.1 MAG: translocase [Thermoproteota archaeon]
MIDFSLNVAGSEWIIIIFVALVLILGTNKLPEAAKKLGRASAEYKKARDEVQNQMKDFSTQNVQVSGPVQNEREKLEMIAKSLGINFAGKTTDELREIISSKIGKPIEPKKETEKTE